MCVLVVGDDDEGVGGGGVTFGVFGSNRTSDTVSAKLAETPATACHSPGMPGPF